MVPLDGLCTKTLYSTAAQFVGDLCANPDNMDLLFDRRKFIIDVLGDVGCSIIPQLEIDADTIEVNTLPTFVSVFEGNVR